MGDSGEHAPPTDQRERHVTTRCERMGEHHGMFMGNHVQRLPFPCSSCYSIESIWRRIPWEPESRAPYEADEFGSNKQDYDG